MTRCRRILGRATALLALAAAATGAAPAAAQDIGAALRSHGLSTLDGGTVRLDDFAGEVLVVNFWASWCAPCRDELPLLDRWHAAWQGRGARVVAISLDQELRNARRQVAETGLALMALHDGPAGLAAVLDLDAVPTTYLLDGTGRVVLVVRGSAPAELERLRQAA
ncbi:MAG: TlpA family protein disulfide reductase, partial [Krumholzibacteria bacterium]|nr:TlpA family protein disulfide reductase [Candidatus Krumholzibacteria bacterium]